ncbi:hypothetical protein dsmv_2532 [Desulfococcus multivorans DSM 2059]|uniref:Uncharacterized protein n=1 Tax=Desulfococcus multivorans DSM 2059 TaxID=1121405 RepID=S7UZQ1_DESML|nr:hypothetical protein dsmv_2532 [Desulfococcus multivorans DSM 2059]SKA04028.1 hypothetical protein SAMN02745446_02515 [Desulfococcus multivorans DSM 2059]
MIKTAAVLETLHRAETFGIHVDTAPQVDMVRLMARKNEILAIQAKGILDLSVEDGNDFPGRPLTRPPRDAGQTIFGLLTFFRSQALILNDLSWTPGLK